MTLAKAVVTGTVYRAPEKRFTQNNVPVSSFVVNIGDREEMLLRVIAKRTALDEVVSALTKDDRVLVEGRLQIRNYTAQDGSKRSVAEVIASDMGMLERKNSNSQVAKEDVPEISDADMPQADSSDFGMSDDLPF
jgi:single-strand DNA-binding protein